MKGLEGEFGAAFVGGSGGEEGESGEGRILKLLADFEFLGGKTEVIVVAGELDGGGVGGGCLDDDFASEVSPTSSTGDLGEELEGAFTGPKVGSVE